MARHTGDVGIGAWSGSEPRRGRGGVVALVLAALLPVLLTVVLAQFRGQLNLVSDMLLFLLVTVAVGFIGGLVSATVAAVVSSLLLNYFFTPPLHTLSITDANNALALVLFVCVGMLVSFAVDLAGRRTWQAAQAAAEAEALAAGNQMRNALLAAVGHDLRTPLAAAKASVSSLRSTDLDFSVEDRGELLATADESLDKLSGLVDNLLDMSRVQAGALSLSLEPTALDEVVARCLDDLGATGRAVIVEYGDGSLLVLADAGLLERVLANLLGNALRYAPDGVPPTLTTALVGGRTEIRIADRGPGIPAEARDRVFLPFQRLGDTDNTTGIGLGLALARGLTEAMGGTLEPADTPGGGLTMVVSLAAAVEGATGPGRRERTGSES